MRSSVLRVGEQMRRREFITLFGGAMTAWPFATRAQPVRMRYVDALVRAKSDYEKISDPSEAARSNYITRLIRMREKAARSKTREWQAIDAEIKRHPAPNDAGGKSFSGLLIGKWRSPRHNYLFRADGTWTMLPAETDEQQNTHGTWHVEQNQFFSTAATRSHRKQASIPLS